MSQQIKAEGGLTVEDCYDILGVSPLAREAEIRQAYRRLAMKHHPDRNAGNESTAEVEFKRIQRAYDTVMAWRRRTQTTPTLAAAQKSYAQAAAGWSPLWKSGWGTDSVPVRGTDLTGHLDVSLETVCCGGEGVATIETADECPACSGAGSHRHACRSSVCADTGGRASAYCTQCHGTGRVSAVCERCAGKGRVLHGKQFRVHVEAGVVEQATVTVPGRGNPGKDGGEAGDAKLTVRILPHAQYSRNGLDLVGKLAVDYVTATLGGTVSVDVLGRKLGVAVPENAKPGTTFRIKGQGLRSLSGAQGDVLLRLELTLPTGVGRLTREHRNILRAMFSAAAG